MSPDQPSSPDHRPSRAAGPSTAGPAGGAARDAVSRDAPEGAANRLFDLRYLIGALFTFFGVVLSVASFFVPHPQSGDVDINLWLGLGMLVLGLGFLLWAWQRPLHLEEGPSAAARAES